MAEHYKPYKYKPWEMNLEQRFQEFHPPYSEREAALEANRCLYCHDAPCMVACPTTIDIPTFIRKISTGNVKGSAKTILESNLMGASCSRVCPVEVLCEGACVLEHDHKPITIGRLQRYAMDYAKDRNLEFFQKGEPNGFKVAVIGSGPAGLSCAGELAKRGFDVTVLEKREWGGGLDTYGIVVFREPVEVSLDEVKMIEKLGVKFKYNVEVGKDVSFDELLKDYDSIFVSVGLGAVPNMSIPGEDLDGVHDGLEFIEETKVKPLKDIKFGERVVVIGAGNTGIDCATIARRLGSERVNIVYRRSEAEMPAYHFEYQFAMNEGVSFIFLTQPIEIIGDENGKVKAVKCIRMDLGPPDASQRRTAVEMPGTEFELPCDMVVKAIGQKKLTSVTDKLEPFGVKLIKGYIEVDNATNRTHHPKIYAGGDCIRSKGEASTVMAVEDGKIAANGIHVALCGEKAHKVPELSSKM